MKTKENIGFRIFETKYAQIYENIVNKYWAYQEIRERSFWNANRLFYKVMFSVIIVIFFIEMFIIGFEIEYVPILTVLIVVMIIVLPGWIIYCVIQYNKVFEQRTRLFSELASQKTKQQIDDLRLVLRQRSEFVLSTEFHSAQALTEEQQSLHKETLDSLRKDFNERVGEVQELLHTIYMLRQTPGKILVK